MVTAGIYNPDEAAGVFPGARFIKSESKWVWTRTILTGSPGKDLPDNLFLKIPRIGPLNRSRRRESALNFIGIRVADSRPRLQYPLGCHIQVSDTLF
jgi:hypothetical protein